MTGEFPAQMASDAENISIWWRHHVIEIQHANLHQAVYAQCNRITILRLYCEIDVFYTTT